MASIARSLLVSQPAVLPSAESLSPADDGALRSALCRCAPAVYAAAREFRRSRNPDLAPLIVCGIIERYTEADLRGKLRSGDLHLSLSKDLGLDSLTMLEVVLLTEEVMQITVDVKNLRTQDSLGQILEHVENQIRPEATR